MDIIELNYRKPQCLNGFKMGDKVKTLWTDGIGVVDFESHWHAQMIRVIWSNGYGYYSPHALIKLED